jgi:hypothetical protein
MKKIWLLILLVALGGVWFWRSQDIPAVAKLREAPPDCSRKAIKFVEDSVKVFKENPQDFNKMWVPVEQRDYDAALQALAGIGVLEFEDSRVFVPAAVKDNLYVYVPEEDGDRYQFVLRKNVEGRLRLERIYLKRK